jgi:murein DD-endopeptidase MepM/ murein hydrolase activator NlpD
MPIPSIQSSRARRLFSQMTLTVLAGGMMALALAQSSYTVATGDTLFAIAKRFAVSIEALQAANTLAGNDIRVGQVLVIPSQSSPSNAPVGQTNAPVGQINVPTTTNLVTTIDKATSITVSHKARFIPGDAVSIRIGNSPNKPNATWNGEALVFGREGSTWVAVGWELLGEPPKPITVVVTVGNTSIQSQLSLVADPKPVQNVFMSQQVLSTLTDANRNREKNLLEAAHSKARSTAQQWQQPWQWPLVSSSISPFAQARRYQQGGTVNYHYGEDLRGKVGTAIRAANDGIVVIAGQYAIRGGLTAIDHGAAVVSLYFHQSRFVVKVGDKVKRGQIIGYVGATGFVNGPHLHWEMRVRGEATDPKQWVGKVWP